MIIISLLIFTIVGSLLYILSLAIGDVLCTKLFNLDGYAEDLKKVISSTIGLSIVVFITSIIYAHGKTINLLFIIPFFILLITNKGKTSIKSTNLLKASLHFSILFASIFILSIFFDYSTSINNDMFLYANIGKQFTIDGKENIFHYFNNILPSELNTGIFPYHYFEMWTLAIFKPLLNFFSSIIILKYLVYIFFKTSIIIGIKAIIKGVFNIDNKYLTIVIITVSLLPYDSFLNLFNAGWGYYTSIWSRPNFLTYIYFLIPFTLFILKNNYYYAIVFLLFLPIASTVTAPSVYIFIFLFSLYSYLRNRITKQEVKLLLLGTFSTAIGIMLIYKYFGVHIKGLELDLNIVLEKYQLLWKAMLFYIVTLPLGLLSLLIPIMITARITNKKNDKFILLLILAFSLSIIGIVLFQLGNFIDNLYQLPYVGYSFIYLLTVIILSKALISKNLKIRLVVLAIVITGTSVNCKDLIIPSSFNLIEQNIIQKENKMKGEFSSLFNNLEMTKGRGLLILGEKAIKSLHPKKRDLISNQYGNFLYYLNSSIELYPFFKNENYYKGENKNPENFVKAHQYNDFFPKELFEENFDSLPLIIKKYDINFLLISGGLKIKACLVKYPNAKQIIINDNLIILILN